MKYLKFFMFVGVMVLLAQCTKDENEIIKPQSNLETIHQDQEIAIGDWEDLISVTKEKVHRLDELLQEYENTSFETKYGEVHFERAISYQRINGSHYALIPIYRNNNVKSFLVSLIVKETGELRSFILKTKDLKDENFKIDALLRMNLLKIFNNLENQNLNTRNWWDLLPDGCYRLVICETCPLGWGLIEIDCEEGPGAGTDEPDDPFLDAGDSSGGGGTTSDGPYGDNPPRGGNGSNGSGVVNLDESLLRVLLNAAARQFINKYDLSLSVQDFENLEGIEDCLETVVDPTTNIIIDVYLNEACAGEKTLEFIYNVDIITVSILDDLIFGEDEEGTLHIYLDPVDMDTASDDEIFAHFADVLKTTHIYFCAGNGYKPIDYRDYFTNIRSVTLTTNWGDCRNMVVDFSDTVSPHYIMETDPAANSALPGGRWKFIYNFADTNIPGLQFTMPESCRSEFYEYIHPDC